MTCTGAYEQQREENLPAVFFRGRRNNRQYSSYTILFFRIRHGYNITVVREMTEERRTRTMFGLIIGILFLVYVIAALIGVAGVIFGAVFSGIGSLISGIFSGKGLVIGIVLGVLAYNCFRKRNAEKTENEENV